MSPKTLTMDGKRYVILEQREYRRLAQRADSRPVRIRRMPNGNLVQTVDAFPFINQSIARTIRVQRKKAGMAQVELAYAAGVRPETVSRIERGQGNPTIRTIERLLRAMGLDPTKV